MEYKVQKDEKKNYLLLIIILHNLFLVSLFKGNKFPLLLLKRIEFT